MAEPKKEVGIAMMVLAIICALASLCASYTGAKLIGELQWGSFLRVVAALLSIAWTMRKLAK